MTVDEVVRQLGVALKLPDLHLSEEGVCRLRIDNSITVNIEKGEDDATINLYSVIGKIPNGSKERLYALLLESNLLGREIDSGAFAIDTVLEEILFVLRIEIQNLGFEGLFQRLEAFVNTSEDWIRRLEQFQPVV